MNKRTSFDQLEIILNKHGLTIQRDTLKQNDITVRRDVGTGWLFYTKLTSKSKLVEFIEQIQNGEIVLYN